MNKITTKSGVHVYNDFRDNLIIDKDDSVFNNMGGHKIECLKSENSEDAITWNVFRTLNQINPEIWLPILFMKAFQMPLAEEHKTVRIKLWDSIAPPPELKQHQKGEGNSEIDICIETEKLVWFIEAKYKSDISRRTTNNENRNQIIRNIDVGTYYAKDKDFYFSLLYLDDKKASRGVDILKKYKGRKAEILQALPHRTDGLMNLKSISLLKWEDLKEVFKKNIVINKNSSEVRYAEAAVEWLEEKGI